ncbi:hypothetical protein BH23CHL8_BH23CHL8_07680 [soil metagenome]
MSDSAAPVVGWHSDRAYWMTCTSPDMLTAWIPLHDCPEEMGPVTYIDGSHRWPISESMRHFNTADLDALQQETMGAGVDGLKRVMAVEKGQMAFHHSCPNSCGRAKPLEAVEDQVQAELEVALVEDVRFDVVGDVLREVWVRVGRQLTEI